MQSDNDKRDCVPAEGIIGGASHGNNNNSNSNNVGNGRDDQESKVENQVVAETQTEVSALSPRPSQLSVKQNDEPVPINMDDIGRHANDGVVIDLVSSQRASEMRPSVGALGDESNINPNFVEEGKMDVVVHGTGHDPSGDESASDGDGDGQKQIDASAEHLDKEKARKARREASAMRKAAGEPPRRPKAKDWKGLPTWPQETPEESARRGGEWPGIKEELLRAGADAKDIERVE